MCVGTSIIARRYTYRTNDGDRSFAIGDRFLFLENDRDLGVKNGMLATVGAIRDGEIVVRLDGAQGPGQEAQDKGRVVMVPVAEYDKFDHGYATTIHKSQGATVDRSYVLASGGMDSHLAYVAMTRHRDAVQLHVGRDDFADRQALVTGLSHANTKETTLDYATRRGIEVEGRRDERAERLLGGEGQAIRVPDTAEREGPKESHTARLLREMREEREAARETPVLVLARKRVSVADRIAALEAREQERVAAERMAGERAMPAPERSGATGRDQALGRTPESEGERPTLAQRLDALRARDAGPAEGREDDGPKLSVIERIEALRERVEGPREREPSQERETSAEPVRKRSIEERLAELHARQITPEERERSREQERERDRDRDRGGYER